MSFFIFGVSRCFPMLTFNKYTNTAVPESNFCHFSSIPLILILPTLIFGISFPIFPRLCVENRNLTLNPDKSKSLLRQKRYMVFIVILHYYLCYNFICVTHNQFWFAIYCLSYGKYRFMKLRRPCRFGSE